MNNINQLLYYIYGYFVNMLKCQWREYDYGVISFPNNAYIFLQNISNNVGGGYNQIKKMRDKKKFFEKEI